MYLDFKLIYLCLMVISSTHSSLAHSHKNESVRPVDSSEPLNEAFAEQGYYLQRLFLEYGINGTLTYEGLQKLLGSLGLGEVSVLEIRHGGVKHSSPSPVHIHPPVNTDRHPHQHTGNKLDELGAPGPNATAGNTEVKVVSSGSAPTASSSTVKPGHDDPSSSSDHSTKNHVHENCLNVTQLLWNFGLGRASHITPAHFTFLCPALLYQIDSGVCLRHTDPDAQEAKYDVHFLKALGWASLALLVISLPSLFALGLAPLIRPATLRTLLCPMAAMAVGTLCGDALLHLLPHANSRPHSDHQDSVLKGLSVLAGLYLLFVFESALGLRQRHKESKKRKRGAEEAREMEALGGSSHVEHAGSSESGHGHSHGPPARGSSGLSTVAWMVVMGDGIHNLTDGLAIGVAFSQSLSGGLSTTIAVLCHELPHELGDLAVLMSAGWPVRSLAVFSLLSALLGYVGVLIGTVLGHQWAQHSPWILTITAGVFLYVALTDMMPEMLHGERGSLGPVTSFVLQSLGLLSGGAIMLCIALFEENIAVNLGDG
ncbi:zinc transporter ZIP5 [Trichomycterus rosablanca]|uniref:zinc transporter ZIP5 n=1 Tax=Trichomycterus rosablanca TaxID=2290929 RepID=UPI002F34EF79